MKTIRSRAPRRPPRAFRGRRSSLRLFLRRLRERLGLGPVVVPPLVRFDLREG